MEYTEYTVYWLKEVYSISPNVWVKEFGLIALFFFAVISVCETIIEAQYLFHSCITHTYSFFLVGFLMLNVEGLSFIDVI